MNVGLVDQLARAPRHDPRVRSRATQVVLSKSPHIEIMATEVGGTS